MRCERCDTRMAPAGRGRIPRFCSSRCRVAAHRERRRLPRELTERDRWVRHDRKRPVTATGRPASATDPATWTSHRTAVESTAGDGLGFVLGGGIACLDLDHCLVDGKPTAAAQAILDRTPGAYTEISPSGDGLHIWGTAPEQPGKRRDGFEAYATGRYITITGTVFRPGGLPSLASFF